jgi:hypothetical protein
MWCPHRFAEIVLEPILRLISKLENKIKIIMMFLRTPYVLRSSSSTYQVARGRYSPCRPIDRFVLHLLMRSRSDRRSATGPGGEGDMQKKNWIQYTSLFMLANVLQNKQCVTKSIRKHVIKHLVYWIQWLPRHAGSLSKIKYLLSEHRNQLVAPANGRLTNSVPHYF